MTDEKEIEEFLKLSVSRVNTYKQCPRKYYYTYKEKMPRKHWPHFDLGSLVHGALEFFHENFKNDTQERPNLKRLMTESFKKQREVMVKDGTVFSKETLFEAKDMLVGYIKRIAEHGIGSEILFIEKDFTIKLQDEYAIHGFIDRIDIDNDGIYHIKDYKTNKNMKYMTPFQLQVYGISLLETFPDVEKFRGSYIMMRFEGTYKSYEFNKEDVIKAKKKLIDYGDSITEEERWPLKPSRLCDWCDFNVVCNNTW
jgi:putative RecB family exonuclease